MENFIEGFVDRKTTRTQTQVIPVQTCEPTHETPPTPRVELVSEDGVVKKIVVTCSCGQQTSLDCQYEHPLQTQKN